ncbi:ATP-dependent DNA ligase, partial [Patescibacteria group bacterium]
SLELSKKTQKEKREEFVRSYSRNLEETTYMYPELYEIADQIDAEEVILDCEAIGIDPKSGMIVPFQQTTTRKRKHGIEEARKSVPLRFYVFDILLKNGKDYLLTPLSKRRKILKQTIKKGEILVVAPQIVTDNASTIRSYHEDQLKEGREGAVIKKWDSHYEPGRRGYGWVKFKETEGTTGKLADTIDAVVMGYYRGEGKRSAFGVGAFLVGVRSGDEFVTVSKVGTGLTDALLKDLKKQFTSIEVEEQPKQYKGVSKLLTPDIWVNPSIVVEIAGDNLTKSPSHGAEYAIRFPRMIGFRKDKSPQEATTVEELSQMYENQ